MCAFFINGTVFSFGPAVIRGFIDFEINKLNARRHSREWRSTKWILLAAICFNEVRITGNFQLRSHDFYEAISVKKSGFPAG